MTSQHCWKVKSESSPSKHAANRLLVSAENLVDWQYLAFANGYFAIAASWSQSAGSRSKSWGLHSWMRNAESTDQTASQTSQRFDYGTNRSCEDHFERSQRIDRPAMRILVSSLVLCKVSLIISLQDMWHLFEKELATSALQIQIHTEWADQYTHVTTCCVTHAEKPEQRPSSYG